MHVLVVDDQGPSREALAEILSEAGYEVVPCGAGQDALVCLRQGTFSVVVTDLRMDGLEGLGCCGKPGPSIRARL